MGMGGQRHAPAALPPGITWYTLNRRLGRPQSRPGLLEKGKIFALPEVEARTVQPVF